ncbi:MAG: CDP-alcohol phosphatidyltransferase family protein [Kiloniellaceae bacterium]
MSFLGPLSLLPNFITLARLLAVPVTVYLVLQGEYGAAFWLFVAAGASDAVDGLLAKRLGVVSEVGAYLDPLADKALLVSVYVALGYMDHVAMWLVFLIVFRDLLIIGGAIVFFALTQSLKMNPLFISKVNTAAQITLAGVILAELGLGLALPFISSALVYIVALTTFLSGAAYVVKWGWLAVTMERTR